MVLTKTVVLEDAEMNQVFWTKCRAVHECGEWLVRFNFPGKVQRFVMKLGDFYYRLAGGLIPRPMSGGFSQFVACLANRHNGVAFLRSFISFAPFVSRSCSLLVESAINPADHQAGAQIHHSRKLPRQFFFLG